MIIKMINKYFFPVKKNIFYAYEQILYSGRQYDFFPFKLVL